jgi:hypothetical protein
MMASMEASSQLQLKANTFSVPHSSMRRGQESVERGRERGEQETDEN